MQLMLRISYNKDTRGKMYYIITRIKRSVESNLCKGMLHCILLLYLWMYHIAIAIVIQVISYTVAIAITPRNIYS